MSQTHVNVDQWTELFRLIGLDDRQMLQWHSEFERHYPDGHQGFLEWLRLPAERITEIRSKSADAAS